tara:strand:- start:7052 stop:9562 length:2511 start_codon:yes stop_codon:yes gene_type:complete
MAAPIWYTKANNLGVIQEARFYQFALDARDPDSSAIAYSVVAGSLPDGIELSNVGNLFGQPKKVVKGVPFEVSQDVTSRFTIRATSTDTIVTDRTFSLTVTGQDVPVFKSDEYLGAYIDYQYINKQIEVTDSDTTDVITYEKLSGDLPSGVTLTTDGYLRGFIKPELVQGEAAIGDYDGGPYDASLFDSGSGVSSYSKLYSFVVRVTDGKAYVVKEFSFFVYGGFDLGADATDVYSDHSTPITADNSSSYSPVIKHSSSELGSYLHDNQFNFQVLAEDYNNDAIEYSISAGELPGNLTIDSATGWIHGNLPFINDIQKEFTFTVKVQKVTDPQNIFFDTYEFKLTLVSDKDLTITWSTPADLGQIVAGEISLINISATSANNAKLSYELLDTSASQLPQGLALQRTGDLQGQVSFKSFQLDAGTTPLDTENTTIDGTYEFTVRAIDNSRTLFADRTFNIRVINNYAEPYENVYIEALPTAEDKRVWERMIYNNTDIPNSSLYRSTDIYFGRQPTARMLFLAGMSPATLAEYAKAVNQNHYNIELRFGDFAFAKANDANGTHIYDVVYVNVIDINDPPIGTIANTSITYSSINNNITVDESAHIDNSNVTSDSYNQNILFPARLTTMKTRIQNILGISDSRTLPAWMTSVQDNGLVLGYTPACVIAYVKPGLGKQILYYLNTNKDIQLNKIQFNVDRYTLDAYFSKNYDKVNNEWITRDETSYDRTNQLEATGDGSTTAFTLPFTINNAPSVFVTINGIAVASTDLTISGQTITLSTPPANATTVKVDDTSYESKEDETTFDGSNTRFFAFSDKSRINVRDGGDYIKFPRTRITDLP